MMAPANQQPTGVERHDLESLVAYLDGELKGPAAADVEQRLANDESFRDAKRQMEQAWALLGELPISNTKPDLSDTTRRTTTMPLLGPQVSTHAASRRHHRRYYHSRRQILAVLGIAAFSGISAHHLSSLFTPMDPLMRDLPIIRNVELYRWAPDTDFLASIARDGYFPDALAPDAESALKVDSEAAHLDDKSPEQRREWLAALSESDRLEWNRKQQLAAQMKPADWERARRLHAFLQESESGAELLGTLRAYTDWLQTLPAAQRTQYLGRSRAEQLEFLATTFGGPTQDAVAAADLVTRTDILRLRDWTERYTACHAEQLVRMLPPLMQKNWERLGKQRQSKLLVGALVRPPRPLEVVNEQDFAELLSELTPETRETLPATEAGQRDVLARWLQRTWGLVGRQTAPSAAQLRTLYQSLSPPQRAYLSTLDPDARRQVVLAIMRQPNSNDMPVAQSAE